MKTKVSEALKDYEPFYERILPTGSRVICDPPPENTDEDYLVLVTPQNLVNLEERLVQDGWVIGGSMSSGGELTEEYQFIEVSGSTVMDHSRVFHSWKRYEIPAVYTTTPHDIFGLINQMVTPSVGPEINLLVTCNRQYFDDFTRATFLSMGLNLTDKADRVMVFEALTRDVWPSSRKKKKKSLLFPGKEYKYEVSVNDAMATGFQVLEEFAPVTALEVAQLHQVQLQQAQLMINPPVVTEPEEFVVGWGEPATVNNPW